MDEFLAYHPLLCAFYQFNALNVFRESCNGYDLNVPIVGWSLPLRAYHYVGSFPVLYYFPIFLIWRDPLSARFLGVLWLALQAWILSKIFSARIVALFVALFLFFPYAFQHIVDTGPIGFHTTSVFLLILLLREWLRTIKLSYLLGIALVIFLGIWTKPTYFWLLPGIGASLLMEAWERRCEFRQYRRRIGCQILLASGLLVALLSALFLSTDPQNPMSRPYLDQVLGSSSYSIGEMFRGVWLESGVVRSLINPYEATQRVFVVASTSLFTNTYTLVMLLIIPMLIAVLWATRGMPFAALRKSAVFYGLFLFTILIIARTRNAGAMHHTILAFPFLILSVIALAVVAVRAAPARLFRIIAGVAVTAFLLGNIILFATFARQEVRGHDDFSKISVNRVLNDSALAQRYFFVVIDWGMYYYQGLFGNREQGVLYMEALDAPWKVDSLRELALSYGRKLLFVYNAKHPASDMQLLTSSFVVHPCRMIASVSVWQVLMEDDTQLPGPC